jgi:hypothetical protein
MNVVRTTALAALAAITLTVSAAPASARPGYSCPCPIVGITGYDAPRYIGYSDYDPAGNHAWGGYPAVRIGSWSVGWRDGYYRYYGKRFRHAR